MGTPQLVELPRMLIAGFSFFGDPFHSYSGWTEENEIGRVWQRLTIFYDGLPVEERRNVDESTWYEIHLEHPKSMEKGEWEVFVGYQVTESGNLPVEMCLKVLPPLVWAIFTLRGMEIPNADPILKEWLAASEYEEAFPMLIERYGPAFKGMDDLENSELDYMLPVRKKE